MRDSPVLNTEMKKAAKVARLPTYNSRPRLGRYVALSLALSGLSVLLVACGPEDRFDPESHWSEGQVGTMRHGLTVGEAGGCSTSIINALSRQLIDEVNCLRPDTLVDFSGPNMTLGAAVFPFLQGGGREDLQSAIQERGHVLNVTSALRTLPQQFLLYSWYQAGRCGISLAARPGRSRHESGLAIDIGDYAAWRGPLETENFSWLGASDPVHFDYEGAGTVDLAGLSVEAFQRLWNRNNPNDLIAEDGLYGPQTEARIRQSPAEGFPLGACPPETPEIPDEPDLAPPTPLDMDPPEPPPRDAGPTAPSEDMSIERDATLVDDVAVVELDAEKDVGVRPPVRRYPTAIKNVGGCAASSGSGGHHVLALLLLIFIARRWRV